MISKLTVVSAIIGSLENLPRYSELASRRR